MHHYIFHFVSFVAFSASKARSSPGWAVLGTDFHPGLCLEGWTPEGWQVEGGWSLLLAPPASSKPPGRGWGFSLQGWEPASCLSQREALAPGSAWYKPPFWEGNVKKVSRPCLRWSKSKCCLTLNRSWGYPASERYCWQDQKKQCHIQCFCRKGLLLMSLTYNKAVFSFSYSLARNWLYLETGFILSAPRACVSLAGWPALSQTLDGDKGAKGLALPLGSSRSLQSGSCWPNAVSIPPSQVLPALRMPGEGSWIPLKDGPYIKGTRSITEKMGIMRSIMEKNVTRSGKESWYISPKVNNPLHKWVIISSALKLCILGNFPGGPAAKTLCSQSRGPRFNPWSGNWSSHEATR